MGSVVGLVESVQHVEEVLNISKILAGLVVLPSDSVPVGIGSDGGY